MTSKDRYDTLIQHYAAKHFPEADWRLIKCQMMQESGGNPRAVSPVGAVGLLQLMPATARGLGVKTEAELYDPERNVDLGVQYLASQYRHFPEIPDHEEKLKFALASYNGGRGYVNKALELAYEEELCLPMPDGHRGAQPGKWRTWDFTKEYLKSDECKVGGRTPDWRQMVEYVSKIWKGYLASQPY